MFTLGSSLVTWCSKWQPTIALSSIEAKYRCLADGTKKTTWLRRLGEEIGFCGTQATSLMCDNQSSVKLTKNLILHAKTKHIEVQYHFIRENILSEEIELTHVSTNEQLVDIFTNPFGRIKFESMRSRLQIQSLEELNKLGI